MLQTPLISTVVYAPAGILSTKLQSLCNGIHQWFLVVQFPLPPCMENPTASPSRQSEVDHWPGLPGNVPEFGQEHQLLEKHSFAERMHITIRALKAKDKLYAIPRTAWNDDHIISHDDLDRLEPMKWLNSVLMDVFVSKLNVKFALPVYDQRVAFLDSTFTLHYILPATKSHDTLKNPAGSIRSKPLKALQHRFKDKGITLIFPPNVNNTHWLVGAIFRASSTIGIFDSLIGESSNQAYHKLAYENMKKVWKVLAEAWFKDLHVPDQEWKFVVHTKIPKQGNVSDCGVFAIMYMIHLGYSSQINQEQVPLAYRLPVHSENLAGM
ncbi:hypothetical protein F5050DRAFT_1811908 [Lentinula boryana]|uniref:Ubiquitin-like protease family profile domain-containing protein n=1 Tax=Lentinula boryana TaxID=40481 RepID=A0ABQ8Q0Y0_9AGAR|nr:hypothetical protein F5050DRAFT_1811908 [Lentinula boryana]